MREFINRDTEGKIIELQKKRDSRIKKIERVVTTGETSVEDIRQRMHKAQLELREQKEVSYDALPDNEEKVRQIHLKLFYIIFNNIKFIFNINTYFKHCERKRSIIIMRQLHIRLKITFLRVHRRIKII